MFVYSLSGLELKDGSGPIAIEVEDNETTARTAVYQTFGRLLLPPDDDGWVITEAGGWPGVLADAGRLLAYDHAFAPQAGGDDRGLHDDALDRHDATLRALTWFDEPDRARDEVIRFYEYFGLRASEDVRPLDHLVTECDFLQYVTYKEAAAGSDRLRNSYRRAQLDFLDRHLRVWLPRASAKLEAAGDAPFLAWVASSLLGYVEADRAYVQGLLGA